MRIWKRHCCVCDGGICHHIGGVQLCADHRDTQGGYPLPDRPIRWPGPDRPCQHCFCQHADIGAVPHEVCCQCHTRRVRRGPWRYTWGR